jgi:hypothetical protein
LRAKLEELGTLARTIVTGRLETLGELEPGDFIRVDYMKMPPGLGAEYVNLERTMFKPLQSWWLNAVVLPGRSKRPFDFLTVNVVKDNAGLGRMNSGYGAESFTYVAVVNRTRELRTIVRNSVFPVLETVH